MTTQPAAGVLRNIMRAHDICTRITAAATSVFRRDLGLPTSCDANDLLNKFAELSHEAQDALIERACKEKNWLRGSYFGARGRYG